MAIESKTPIAKLMEGAASQAGLVLEDITPGKDFSGQATSIFDLGLGGADGRSVRLELSDACDFNKPEVIDGLKAHLVAAAKRLRNPHPDSYVTLGGIPVALGRFQWPFHLSTSGADTYIVHGEMHLTDGGAQALFAKLAASVTVTFAEIVPAMEQPFTESFVYNAIRKTVDLGQLEFLKSGNRQPVPVTTRFYSRWQKKFVFNDTTEAQRLEYLLSKVYWLSGVLGEGKPVWIADPRDAQYLNTSEAELMTAVAGEAAGGLIAVDGDFATPTAKLMARAPQFRAALDAALNFTKPQFNESMRSGHANM